MSQITVSSPSNIRIDTITLMQASDIGCFILEAQQKKRHIHMGIKFITVVVVVLWWFGGGGGDDKGKICDIL